MENHTSSSSSQPKTQRTMSTGAFSPVLYIHPPFFGLQSECVDCTFTSVRFCRRRRRLGIAGRLERPAQTNALHLHCWQRTCRPCVACSVFLRRICACAQCDGKLHKHTHARGVTHKTHHSLALAASHRGCLM